MLNPYNFSSPVKDINLLFGRGSELINIKYYLQQGNLSNSPISIALIGDRASGKTSIINATEEIAKSLDYLTVRIDLNESDVNGDDRFFYKLFDGLVFEMCNAGHFGGIGGGFYSEYIDLISGGSVENRFCPLNFPRIYGKINSNTPGSYINDNIIVRDFKLIRDELGNNIIFLIDEANLISKNLSILQKLRNIIMKISGYSILIAGTDSIFPSIDEVFSPIARQFVKIQVGPFANVADTADCVLRPLEMRDETNKFRVSDRTLHEIHNMTFGKPYEIQFVCHTLFKRAEEDNSFEMRINMDAMKSVMKQLVDLSARSDSSFIKFCESMPSEDLKILRIVESYLSGVSPELLRRHLRIFFNYNDNQIENLDKIIQRFIDNGIVRYDSEKIRFAGDAFEAIYVKYLGRQTVSDYTPPDTTSNVWASRIVSKLLFGIAPEFHRFTIPPSVDFFTELPRIVKLINSSRASEMHAHYEFVILKEIYDRAFYFKEGQAPTVINIKVAIAGADVNLVLIKNQPTNDIEAEINRRIEALKQKIISQGGRLYYSTQRISLPRRGNLVDAVVEINDASLMADVAHVHEQHIHELHTSMGDLSSRAIEVHISALMKYVDKVDRDYNNLGYILTKNGRSIEATRVLISSLQAISQNDYFRRAIIHYNLAIALYATLSFSESLKNAEDALRFSEHLAKVRRECECLLYIDENDRLVEIRQSPDIHIYSQKLIDQIIGRELVEARQ